MEMVMMVVVEGDDEADSSTPLCPGLLTPTSGLYESQQVVSSSCVDYMPLPSTLSIISAVTSQKLASRALGENPRIKGSSPLP